MSEVAASCSAHCSDGNTSAAHCTGTKLLCAVLMRKQEAISRRMHLLEDCWRSILFVFAENLFLLGLCYYSVTAFKQFIYFRGPFMHLFLITLCPYFPILSSDVLVLVFRNSFVVFGKSKVSIWFWCDSIK